MHFCLQHASENPSKNLSKTTEFQPKILFQIGLLLKSLLEPENYRFLTWKCLNLGPQKFHIFLLFGSIFGLAAHLSPYIPRRWQTNRSRSLLEPNLASKTDPNKPICYAFQAPHLHTKRHRFSHLRSLFQTTQVCQNLSPKPHSSDTSKSKTVGGGVAVGVVNIIYDKAK